MIKTQDSGFRPPAPGRLCFPDAADFYMQKASRNQKNKKRRLTEKLENDF
jgi:hypothetical protein